MIYVDLKYYNDLKKALGSFATFEPHNLAIQVVDITPIDPFTDNDVIDILKSKNIEYFTENLDFKVANSLNEADGDPKTGGEEYKGIFIDRKTGNFKILTGRFPDKKAMIRKYGVLGKGYIVRKVFERSVFDWIVDNAENAIDSYLMFSTAFSKWKDIDILKKYYSKLIDDLPQLFKNVRNNDVITQKQTNKTKNPTAQKSKENESIKEADTPSSSEKHDYTINNSTYDNQAVDGSDSKDLINHIVTKKVYYDDFGNVLGEENTILKYKDTKDNKYFNKALLSKLSDIFTINPEVASIKVYWKNKKPANSYKTRFMNAGAQNTRDEFDIKIYKVEDFNNLQYSVYDETGNDKVKSLTDNLHYEGINESKVIDLTDNNKENKKRYYARWYFYNGVNEEQEHQMVPAVPQLNVTFNSNYITNNVDSIIMKAAFLGALNREEFLDSYLGNFENTVRETYSKSDVKSQNDIDISNEDIKRQEEKVKQMGDIVGNIASFIDKYSPKGKITKDISNFLNKNSYRNFCAENQKGYQELSDNSKNVVYKLFKNYVLSDKIGIGEKFLCKRMIDDSWFNLLAKYSIIVKYFSNPNNEYKNDIKFLQDSPNGKQLDKLNINNEAFINKIGTNENKKITFIYKQQGEKNTLPSDVINKITSTTREIASKEHIHDVLEDIVKRYNVVLDVIKNNGIYNPEETKKYIDPKNIFTKNPIDYEIALILCETKELFKPFEYINEINKQQKDLVHVDYSTVPDLNIDNIEIDEKDVNKIQRKIQNILIDEEFAKLHKKSEQQNQFIWFLDGMPVDIREYGISFEGVPQNDHKITIVFNSKEGINKEVIPLNELLNKIIELTNDKNKISTTSYQKTLYDNIKLFKENFEKSGIYRINEKAEQDILEQDYDKTIKIFDPNYLSNIYNGIFNQDDIYYGFDGTSAFASFYHSQFEFSNGTQENVNYNNVFLNYYNNNIENFKTNFDSFYVRDMANFDKNKEEYKFEYEETISNNSKNKVFTVKSNQIDNVFKEFKKNYIMSNEKLKQNAFVYFLKTLDKQLDSKMFKKDFRLEQNKVSKTNSDIDKYTNQNFEIIVPEKSGAEDNIMLLINNSNKVSSLAEYLMGAINTNSNKSVIIIDLFKDVSTRNEAVKDLYMFGYYLNKDLRKQVTSLFITKDQLQKMCNLNNPNASNDLAYYVLNKLIKIDGSDKCVITNDDFIINSKYKKYGNFQSLALYKEKYVKPSSQDKDKYDPKSEEYWKRMDDLIKNQNKEYNQYCEKLLTDDFNDTQYSRPMTAAVEKWFEDFNKDKNDNKTEIKQNGGLDKDNLNSVLYPYLQAYNDFRSDFTYPKNPYAGKIRSDKHFDSVDYEHPAPGERPTVTYEIPKSKNSMDQQINTQMAKIKAQQDRRNGKKD